MHLSDTSAPGKLQQCFFRKNKLIFRCWELKAFFTLLCGTVHLSPAPTHKLQTQLCRSRPIDVHIRMRGSFINKTPPPLTTAAPVNSTVYLSCHREEKFSLRLDGRAFGESIPLSFVNSRRPSSLCKPITHRPEYKWSDFTGENLRFSAEHIINKVIITFQSFNLRISHRFWEIIWQVFLSPK